MDAERDEPAPELGRAEWDEITDAPHAVVGEAPDIEAARRLIEDLENHGIPANAIELLETETKDPRAHDAESDVVESPAFANLSKSVVVGGTLGIVLGGLLGLLMSYLVPDLAWYWGATLGGLFGAAVGGAAGGMSVAKYSSPAWDETYQVEDTPEVKVAVHHSDPEVVEIAWSGMSRHVDNVKRLDRS